MHIAILLAGHINHAMPKHFHDYHDMFTTLFSGLPFGEIFCLTSLAVVDDDVFNSVNEKLKFVKGIRKGNSKEIYLLKGKCFCGDCGKSMWIEGSGKLVKGKSYRYYRCSSYKEIWKSKRRGIEVDENSLCNSGVRGNKISKDKLDDIVWNGLFRILINSDVVSNKSDPILIYSNKQTNQKILANKS